jgi:hypothetical protein
MMRKSLYGWGYQPENGVTNQQQNSGYPPKRAK